MEQILDLDSKSAVTIFTSVSVVRSNPHEELGAVDLENYISQAIWKLFDKCRSEAAERLDVNEVDLLLTDARIMGVKIDGNTILNPRGFTGRELEIFLSITMTKRDMFVEGHSIFEGGVIRAYLLAKENTLDNAIYAEINRDVTNIFIISTSEIAYSEEFKWGIANIIGAISEQLNVAEPVAFSIYHKYINGEISLRVSREIDKIFYTCFDNFIGGITANIKKIVGKSAMAIPPVYIKSSISLPKSVWRKRFYFKKKQIKLFEVSGNLDIKKFIEDEVHEIYNELNQLAQRRIKWLMPGG